MTDNPAYDDELDNDQPDATFVESDWPLEGPWQVRLVIPIEEAGSPAEAVEEFFANIVDFGLRTYMYRVQHKVTGESWYVQDNKTMTAEEADAAFELSDADDASDS